jgi:hypothetical protein
MTWIMNKNNKIQNMSTSPYQGTIWNESDWPPKTVTVYKLIIRKGTADCKQQVKLYWCLFWVLYYYMLWLKVKTENWQIMVDYFNEEFEF